MPSEQRPWHANALLLAVAGSIIAVIGQLAGTVIPIMYGSEDISDFTMNLEPVSRVVDSQNSTTLDGQYVTANVTIKDLHRWLRPYRFKIQFQALGSIDDSYALFDPPEIQLPGRLERWKPVKSTYKHSDQYGNSRHIDMSPDMTGVYINTRSKSIGDYPIIIQAIGSNGKTHNSTFTLRIVSREDYLKSVNGTMPLRGGKIHS